MKIGTIVEWPSNTLPDETFLFAHGQAVSRITYADLFSVIGTTYGAGDGSTTFNVPNYKGRVGVGLDSNDTDFDTLGETLGEKEHTLTVNEMPSHTHGYYDYYGLPSEGGSVSRLGVAYNSYTIPAEQGVGTKTTGGGQPHNIIQPSIVTNYIIKALNPDSIKISELESASSVTSSDVLPIVQNGETKKVEYDTIKSNIENSIIESGSNTNGTYIKYSDGTLICRGTINVGTVPSNNSTTQGWVFPYQPLNTNYQVVTSTRIGSNFWSWLKERTTLPTVYGITLEVWNNGSDIAGASAWDAIMIGRWK